VDKPEWDDLKDLRGDMWCHCILALLSIFIAGTALVWLTMQQNQIEHLQHLVNVQTYQHEHSK
jgi:hypothetical protein